MISRLSHLTGFKETEPYFEVKSGYGRSEVQDLNGGVPFDRLRLKIRRFVGGQSNFRSFDS